MSVATPGRSTSRWSARRASLSRSAEAIDEHEKLAEYTSIPALRDYVLVSTTRPHVTHWQRGEDGRWRAEVFGADEAVELRSVDVTLWVAEIYRGVKLDPAHRPRRPYEP